MELSSTQMLNRSSNNTMLTNYFENRNFDIFDMVVHNFGKSGDDVIFPIDTCVHDFVANLYKKSWTISITH